jgi:hypothetical protein
VSTESAVFRLIETILVRGIIKIYSGSVLWSSKGFGLCQTWNLVFKVGILWNKRLYIKFVKILFA